MNNWTLISTSFSTFIQHMPYVNVTVERVCFPNGLMEGLSDDSYPLLLSPVHICKSMLGAGGPGLLFLFMLRKNRDLSFALKSSYLLINDLLCNCWASRPKGPF